MARWLDALCVLAIGLLVAACTLDSGDLFDRKCVCIAFVYLVALASLIGAQVWVMGVAGLIMIRTLPRSMFRLVQGELFPAFFSFCLATTCIALTAVMMRYPCHLQSPEVQHQVYVLCVMVGLAVIQRLFILRKNKTLSDKLGFLEREAGVSEVVGFTKESEELQRSPNYRSARRSFGMWHGISMLFAAAHLLLALYHLFYVAKQLWVEPTSVPGAQEGIPVADPVAQ